MSIRNNIKTTAYFILIISNLSCQEKKDTSLHTQNEIKMTDNIKNDIIKKVLSKQLLEGNSKSIDEAGAELPKIQFSVEDLNAASQTANYILTSNGYNELTNDQFKEKIESIFNRIIDSNSNNQFLYLNYLDKCSRDIVMYDDNGVDYSGIYIDKVRKNITDFYYLPEIIDYKNGYPQLAELELIKAVRYRSTDNSEVEIPHWKDDKSLNYQRKKNIQTIIARNMFLFNDSKSYSTWLVTHDKNFVKTLVKLYGYTKEPKFNDLVMNDFKEKEDAQHPEDVGNIIFVKNCNNKLEIRNELLKYITNHVNQDESSLYDALEQYGYHLLDNKNDENNFTRKEKIQILAYIANTLSPIYYNIGDPSKGWAYGTMLYNLSVSNSDLLPEIEKNDYYGLPNLKEVIKHKLPDEAPASGGDE